MIYASEELKWDAPTRNVGRYFKSSLKSDI